MQILLKKCEKILKFIVNSTDITNVGIDFSHMEVCNMKVELNNQGRYIDEVSIPKTEKPEIKNEQIEKTEKVEKKEAPKTQEEIERQNEKVREIAEKLNKELESLDTSIEFKIHESSGIGLNKISIKVVEKESEKVVAEIPSEEAIEMAEKMEEITGILFDHRR